MDRQAWLDDLRASVEERYDRLYSPTFDEDAPISSTHLEFVERVIQSCPPGGAILDAPCGTGRYVEKVLAAGRTVVGIDQSAGMLARARAKHPEARSRETQLAGTGFRGRLRRSDVHRRNGARLPRGLAVGSRQFAQGGARPWTHLPDHRAGRRGGDRRTSSRRPGPKGCRSCTERTFGAGATTTTRRPIASRRGWRVKASRSSTKASVAVAPYSYAHLLVQ